MIDFFQAPANENVFFGQWAVFKKKKSKNFNVESFLTWTFFVSNLVNNLVERFWVGFLLPSHFLMSRSYTIMRMAMTFIPLSLNHRITNRNNSHFLSEFYHNRRNVFSFIRATLSLRLVTYMSPPWKYFRQFYRRNFIQTLQEAFCYQKSQETGNIQTETYSKNPQLRRRRIKFYTSTKISTSLFRSRKTTENSHPFKKSSTLIRFAP